ncbi:MAG: helix-turn-helix domain-containing protein [Chlorobi bacterium]|nr:helix-turn-helix domain-containing protein [Chlorobiota bacterium]
MKLYIKNMVCNRCVKVVGETLEKLGFTVRDIILGEVEIAETPEDAEREKISEALEKEGFELIADPKVKIIEDIKTSVIEIIQRYSDVRLEEMNFSDYLSKKLEKEYSYLSALFSKTEGMTIEHFVILQKIEKVKELLKYGELTLSEIAYDLGYSSVQHLSRQLKNVTGFTATELKKNLKNLRKSLDSV